MTSIWQRNYKVRRKNDEQNTWVEGSDSKSLLFKPLVMSRFCSFSRFVVRQLIHYLFLLLYYEYFESIAHNTIAWKFHNHLNISMLEFMKPTSKDFKPFSPIKHLPHLMFFQPKFLRFILLCKSLFCNNFSFIYTTYFGDGFQFAGYCFMSLK